ncbi:hypothetical protein [Pseudoflavonifractor gallinarum]|uniref:hypothetical protein n=1 Tax=Pseudoflavonifractor gallinarum TaxID=2779352 RepID=UPI0036F25ACE
MFKGGALSVYTFNYYVFYLWRFLFLYLWSYGPYHQRHCCFLALSSGRYRRIDHSSGAKKVAKSPNFFYRGPVFLLDSTSDW